MKQKLNNFLNALEEYGDYFFSCGNTKKDYEMIKGVLDAQGYWSGTSYRYYFDNDLNLVSVEERW